MSLEDDFQVRRKYELYVQYEMLYRTCVNNSFVSILFCSERVHYVMNFVLRDNVSQFV